MIQFVSTENYQFPYKDVLDEYPDLNIVVCLLRHEATDDFRKGLYESVVKRLQGIGPVDRLIIDDITEAVNLDKVDEVFDHVVDRLGIPRQNIIFINGGEERRNYVLPYPTFYHVDSFRLEGYSKETVVPWHTRTNLLISLCRRPNWFRVALTEELIKRNLLEHSIVSCGSDKAAIDDGWIDLFVTPELQHYFPLTVDGFISREDEYTSNGTEFTNAYVNIVSETSHDVRPNGLLLLREWIMKMSQGDNAIRRAPNGLHHWERLFVTEKTIKPFAMRQIPIFNTVKHHVKFLRTLGLDLFDDVIDQSYDNIDDPAQRVRAVAVQAETAYKRGFEYFRNIPNIETRLEYNVECIRRQRKIKMQEAEQQLREFLNHGNVTI
jgi:hypothetical protein